MEAEVRTTEESAGSSGCNQLRDVGEHLCTGLICDEPEKMKNFQDPLLESNHAPAKTACAVGASVSFENRGGTFQNWPSNTLTPPRLGSLGLAVHKGNEHEVIMSTFCIFISTTGRIFEKRLWVNFLKRTHTQASTKVCNRLE